MKKRLFGTRGIRGPVHVKVSPELAFKLGLALAELTGGGEVVVGRDTRVTGEMLFSAFSAGLMAGGSDVLDVGIVPSPCLAFATKKLGASAGTMITASHNPPTDNGLTFYTENGSEFTGEREVELERLVLDVQPKMVEWMNVGSVYKIDITEEYITDIEKKVKVDGGVKVVVDPANGAASGITPVLLRRLGCEVVTINSHPDGHFPGRPAEPQPWNLGELMAVVKKVGADLGIAHDGDADRLAVIDENGDFIKHDTLIAFFAQKIVRERGGGIVITSVNTSKSIEEVVQRMGGKVIRVPLGAFTEGLIEHQACFAGEPGKLVFLEHGMWADGIFSAAKVVELISKERKPISRIFKESVPDYSMYHEDFHCRDEMKPYFMEHMKRHVLKEIGDIEKIIDIDGARIERKNGSWVLVRVSGTEPKARVVIEGRSLEELEDLKNKIVEEARRFLDARMR
ncbi:MAG: phosphoglucosamine mutase [Candidatus Hadarchaeales archaeon]